MSSEQIVSGSVARVKRAQRLRIDRRAGCLCLVMSMALMILAGRVFQLQIVDGPELARKAVAQRTAALSLELDRGNIYDRNLRALHAPFVSWNLVAYVPFVGDVEETALELGRRLGLPAAGVTGIKERLQAEGHDFVVLARELPPALAKAVPGWNLPGVVAVPYQERYGPGAVAQHVVGYINRSDNHGVAGLEAAFDDVMKGGGGRALLAMFDAHGRPLSPYRLRLSGQENGGNELVTTIDWGLQERVQAVLARANRPGAAVVVDARNGDILAMASHPTFVQNRIADFLQENRGDPLVNRAVRAYPPGSVFKTVVAAVALEAGVLAAFDRVECTGDLTIGERRYVSQCPPGTHDGVVDWQEALAASSNEVFIRLGVAVGAERLLYGARRFGFGQPTGLPLPEELAGELPVEEEMRYLGNLANLSIGQGPLTVTPVQVAQFFTALVNNGELQPLRLVQEIRRPDGVLLRSFQPPPRRRVMSTETAALLRQALRLAVTHGTGQLAEVPRLGAGGKTGTAETGRYLADGRQLAHAWFAGFVPATLPRYVIVVVIEDGMSGPEVAAPRFREIAQALAATAGGR